MGEVCLELNETQYESDAHLSFARSYQLEALELARKQNTIVFLETGSGKTLIAIMLLRSFAHLLRRPSQPYLAIFLVPTVVLVAQQAKVVETHTDLKVGKYWGDMGVDFWDAATWKKELQNHEVLVMTPKILLDALSHTYIKLDMIKVLIFDECHNARGKHPYASIMKDFYHRQLHTHEVPRIFGMTASPIKTKVKGWGADYWKDICHLENLMNSKVYTCASEAVLAQYISFPNSKVQFYNDDVPDTLQIHLIDGVHKLRDKHATAVRSLDIETSVRDSLCSKLRKLASTFEFCLRELGLWSALKATEISSLEETDIFTLDTLDACGRTTLNAFISDAQKMFSTFMISGLRWTISSVKNSPGVRLLTSKVLCLAESLLGYRTLKDLRCIIFVERVVTAMVFESILGELLFQESGWRARYIAGNQSALKSQSRKVQNEIVEEFRRGTIHILIATSILEEGLDVQSCNLVVRFDPSFNVCSFIQSRGRARMQNSEFLLMVRRGDIAELTRVEQYLSSGDRMRKESLGHASLPCQSVEFDELDSKFYYVPSTGAIVTLSSSVSLIYFYCSRLPSDGYFKPSPCCVMDEASHTCTVRFPNSCPIESVTVRGNEEIMRRKMLKQLACLEACKKLHEIGALTDNLVPEIVLEERLVHQLDPEPYNDNQPRYVPSEIVSSTLRDSTAVCHCYLLELKRDFVSDIPMHNLILVLKDELDSDVGCTSFDLELDWGNMAVNLKYSGTITLTNEQVAICRLFQVAVLRVLRHRDLDNLAESVKGLYNLGKDGFVHGSHYDFLLLPCQWLCGSTCTIDWKTIWSASFLLNMVQVSFTNCDNHGRLHHGDLYTKNGFVSPCVLQNCLVCTPHNGYIYCVSGLLDGMNGNSLLMLKDGENITYKNYYKRRHGIDLVLDKQTLLSGRQVFRPQNYLLKCRQRREREASDASVELPPELCIVIMSPISVATLYTFSFVPSIMHRVESLLLSANLRRIILDGMQNIFIPVTKVLEALTSKHCLEGFHLESLETLGDSFLKYAVCQQLFKTLQNNHEGLLSIKKEKIISNVALCNLGCKNKISGFIRFEVFDPKSWPIPGDLHGNFKLEEHLVGETKIYSKGIRKIKDKRVADVVEALIGAFLSTGGEVAALVFMNWLGIEADLSHISYQRNFPINPYAHVNIRHLESVLNYPFKDPSLLVEALTHGSYMLPEIPRCYQRLEFLGDSVLDHLITVHLFRKYPGMSPGLLTELRSSSVNNDCYAQSTIRAGLHKHILHASQKLYKQLAATVVQYSEVALQSTFGWESEIDFPKVLADVIESLAGAIYVDSGGNKDIVFKSISPLLEPLVTPETLKLHPVSELNILCQKHNFNIGKPIRTFENGVPSTTLEVEANGVMYRHTCTAKDKLIAKKIASKAILKSLKDTIPDL